jgi:hypothetical protein
MRRDREEPIPDMMKEDQRPTVKRLLPLVTELSKRSGF